MVNRKKKDKSSKIDNDIKQLVNQTRLSKETIKRLTYSDLILEDNGDVWIKLKYIEKDVLKVMLLPSIGAKILSRYLPPFYPDNNIPLLAI